jgi:nicotinamidase-related amidase
MQLLFSPGGPWAVPWSEKVLPVIAKLAQLQQRRTVFTRFIPADRPGDGQGSWARYYKRWASVTLANIEPTLIELVPALSRFVPPAHVVDKRVYSPWTEGNLDHLLKGLNTHTLVITGAETDVCVLATVLGAVDRGYRVVLVTDAICSSADQTHDALMELYRSRFAEQIEIAEMQEVLENWTDN